MKAIELPPINKLTPRHLSASQPAAEDADVKIGQEKMTCYTESLSGEERQENGGLTNERVKCLKERWWSDFLRDIMGK